MTAPLGFVVARCPPLRLANVRRIVEINIESACGRFQFRARGPRRYRRTLHEWMFRGHASPEGPRSDGTLTPAGVAPAFGFPGGSGVAKCTGEVNCGFTETATGLPGGPAAG